MYEVNCINFLGEFFDEYLYFLNIDPGLTNNYSIISFIKFSLLCKLQDQLKPFYSFSIQLTIFLGFLYQVASKVEHRIWVSCGEECQSLNFISHTCKVSVLTIEVQH
jgi:hypothetical protein